MVSQLLQRNKGCFVAAVFDAGLASMDALMAEEGDDSSIPCTPGAMVEKEMSEHTTFLTVLKQDTVLHVFNFFCHLHDKMLDAFPQRCKQSISEVFRNFISCLPQLLFHFLRQVANAFLVTWDPSCEVLDVAPVPYLVC